MSSQSTTRRDAPQSGARPAPATPSAERALDDLRGTAAADAAALLKAEMERCRDATRKALDSLKGMVATLERSCDEAIAGGRAAATQEIVAGFAEKLAAAARAAADVAAQRGRAEVRVELEKLETTLADVRSQLDQAREHLKTATSRLETEHAGRTRAEAELKSEREALTSAREKLQAEQAARTKAEAEMQRAEQARRELASAHESQIQGVRAELAARQEEVSRLQQEIDAEKSERAGLVAAIQRLVHPADAAAAAKAKPVVKAPDPGRANGGASSTAAPPRAAEPAPKPKDSRAESQAPPELVVYVQHLFKTLESMYQADVSAGRSSNDLVNRLTQNLRSARNVFRNHIGAAENADLTLFDEQLNTLMDDPEETAFARHLGIAAYECSKPEHA